jgi:hypothetical protein
MSFGSGFDSLHRVRSSRRVDQAHRILCVVPRLGPTPLAGSSESRGVLGRSWLSWKQLVLREGGNRSGLSSTQTASQSIDLRNYRPDPDMRYWTGHQVAGSGCSATPHRTQRFGALQEPLSCLRSLQAATIAEPIASRGEPAPAGLRHISGDLDGQDRCVWWLAAGRQHRAA